MTRRNFPNRVKGQIVTRAMNADGRVVCEGCGLVLGRKPYEIDHTLPEALVMDKSRDLTADDGKLLGKDCCHAPKTRVDIARIAKSKRQARRHLGIKGSARPMDGSRNSPWKKTFNHGTVPR